MRQGGKTPKRKLKKCSFKDLAGVYEKKEGDGGGSKMSPEQRVAIRAELEDLRKESKRLKKPNILIKGEQRCL